MFRGYQDFFKGANINLVVEIAGAKSNHWLNALVLDDLEQRDLFLEATNISDIMTRPIWALMSKLPMFKDCQKGDLSNAEWLEDRVVNIPSSVVNKV